MPDGDHFAFDVFISYSSKDQTWVRGELLKRIEQAGLKAFIDFRDFTRGAPSLKEMERGVTRCRKTLLVLTPDYLRSEWCEIENIMLQTLDPANRGLRLIPLLKSPCERPLRIGALTHIDFTDGADLDLAWRQLLTALGAPPEPPAPKQPERDDWFLAHPYPMPPNFTGRLAERDLLTRWLDADAAHPLLSLRALGGFGKSALVWHWLTHDVKPAAWPRVVWWSFYEGDASFDSFLARTLEYLSGNPAKSSSLSTREQLDKLVQLLHQSGSLLVLDGFERALRLFGGLNAPYQGDGSSDSEGARLCEPQHRASRNAPGNFDARTTATPLRVADPRSGTGALPGHGSTLGPLGQRSWASQNDCDCISPLAEMFLRNVSTLPGIRAKVLLTTRLCPRVLEAIGGGLLQGCREEELRQMQPADAVEFFRAQGIRGTRTEIEAACDPYGYHPLSLRLLAGLIVGDFQQPGDIAAAQRLDVSGDLIACQHHVLETAYNSLTPARRALLGRIACFRSPVKYDALKAIAETEARGLQPASTPAANGTVKRPEGRAPALDADLRDLIARGLLHHDTKEGRFDLHPIVRRYAYDRLAGPDRTAAHTRLRDYFAAVPKPDNVTRIEDLAPVIELYWHTVRAGQFDEAFLLYRDRLKDPLYVQLGAYQLEIELLRSLFPDGEGSPPRLPDANAQGWTLNQVANSYSLNGQPQRAVALFEAFIAVSRKRLDMINLAVGLANLAGQETCLGELRASEANVRRSIDLSKQIKAEFLEAGGQAELARLSAYRGFSLASEKELGTVLKMGEHTSTFPITHGVTWSYRALGELLLIRQVKPSESSFSNRQSAIPLARRALERVDETARKYSPVERDYVRAHWLLGAAHRVAGQLDEAERHLHEALERCRRINMVDHEADILIDLARLRAATGARDEAQRLAEEALLITERSGYVLQGADAHLELAKLALGFYAPSSPPSPPMGEKETATPAYFSQPSPPSGEKVPEGRMRGRDWWSGASFSDLVAEAAQRASPAQRQLALAHAKEARRLATCDGPPDYTYKAAYDEAGALLAQLETNTK